MDRVDFRVDFAQLAAFGAQAYVLPKSEVENVQKQVEELNLSEHKEDSRFDEK